MTVTTTPVTPDLLRGCLDTETTADGLVPHRLPAWVRARGTDPQLAMVEAEPAGVRLAFRSRATYVELDARSTRRVYTGLPARPPGVYELVVDGRPAGSGSLAGGTLVTIDIATGSTTVAPGAPGTIRFAGLHPSPKDVEIWLPHNERAELLALRTDAPVEASPPSPSRTWLHHGSSVSQGSNAVSPTGTWPAVAARLAGVELVNLGFGGSALLDPFVGRVIRDSPADLISVKLGINLVNTDVMRRRALGPAVHGLLDSIRDGHPDTPLLVVSSILCPIHEDTPGPGALDIEALHEGRIAFVAAPDAGSTAGRLTLAVVREELAGIVAQRSADDRFLHYLDGRRLYGPGDSDALPLPDRLHPDAATHRLMGGRFAALALAPGGPLAADVG